MTELRPFFSFYGGKWRLAPKYPEPKYETIIEPFAGSAGYAMRYPEKQVILVERDPQVAAIWRWLITEASPSDVLNLPRLKQGEYVDDYAMPQEARWLMGLWADQAQSRPRHKVTKFGAVRQRHERTAAQLKYIRHWKIIEGSYWQAPDIQATWFIDPPYQVAGLGHYKFGPKTIDYDYLADWCRTRQGQTMVCEGIGADWLPFSEFATAQRTSTNYSECRTYKEMVWLNEIIKQDCRLAS